MQKIVETIKKVSAVDSTVLVLGETGVGKSRLVRHLHEVSNRKNESFYEINCAALPTNLIESELFGYSGGSFTGANREGKKGLLESAHKGTLFLDEIGEMPLETQAKLLQVLQEKTFRPIGGRELKKVDVRIVAATNRDLSMMVKTRNISERFILSSECHSHCNPATTGKNRRHFATYLSLFTTL